MRSQQIGSAFHHELIDDLPVIFSVVDLRSNVSACVLRKAAGSCSGRVAGGQRIEMPGTDVVLHHALLRQCCLLRFGQDAFQCHEKEEAVNILRSSLIGLWMGILPGVGATVGAMVAYSTAKNMSKTPEQYPTVMTPPGRSATAHQ